MPYRSSTSCDFFFKLFFFVLLLARPTHTGHPVNKTTAWRVKHRSANFAWVTAQKLICTCAPLPEAKRPAGKGSSRVNQLQS
jgi:hypothetical protein